MLFIDNGLATYILKFVLGSEARLFRSISNTPTV